MRPGRLLEVRRADLGRTIEEMERALPGARARLRMYEAAGRVANPDLLASADAAYGIARARLKVARELLVEYAGDTTTSYWAVTGRGSYRICRDDYGRLVIEHPKYGVLELWNSDFYRPAKVTDLIDYRPLSAMKEGRTFLGVMVRERRREQ